MAMLAVGRHVEHELMLITTISWGSELNTRVVTYHELGWVGIASSQETGS